MAERLDYALELKAVDPAQRIIEGYASVTGNEDNNGDVVDSGAFAETLKSQKPSDIPVFVGHKHNELPVGMPLVIREDARGLYTRTKVFPTKAGDDLLAVAQASLDGGRGLGMSIGYAPTDTKWESKDGQQVRHITNLYLGEYSFTAMPANESARIMAIKSRLATKAVAAMSAEERRSEVQEAINARTRAPLATAPGPYTYVIETYDDHVIVCDENDDYWSIPYTLGADGEATIGEPVEVERTWTPATKSRQGSFEEKAGRRYSSATAALLKERLGAARRALDEIEADITAATESPAADDSKSIATKVETVPGPWALDIALAKARGGLYA
jgi:HK97 family phage prohead protease